LFLVGDYPPHMDYRDDVKYPAACGEAVKRGIVVNTVQCGLVTETTRVWREIARLSEGEYVALEQSGNMAATASPFDDDIARASAELGGTLVAYGDRERQEAAKGKVVAAAAAAPGVAADRAAYNLSSGGGAIQGAGDLVADLAEGRATLSAVPEDQLPPEMRKMTERQRAAYVERMKAKRVELNAKLAELTAKRAAWIDAERKKAVAAGALDSFDLKVTEIITEQAARLSK
jgi:hypothetical protein